MNNAEFRNVCLQMILLKYRKDVSTIAEGTVRGVGLRTLPHPLRGSSLPEGAYGQKAHVPYVAAGIERDVSLREDDILPYDGWKIDPFSA